MVKEVLHDFDRKMKSSLEHFRKELSRLRTGRANLGIFEDIKVDYYGVADAGQPDRPDRHSRPEPDHGRPLRSDPSGSDR